MRELDAQGDVKFRVGTATLYIKISVKKRMSSVFGVPLVSRRVEVLIPS